MNVLVISAHPDDETLGCGGTLLKHRSQGHRIHWLVVTRAHTPQWTKGVIQRKANEVKRVAEAYGMEQCIRLHFPAVYLDTVPVVELIQEISQAITVLKPEVVYVVHQGDVHTDHQRVFQATGSMLKSFRMSRSGVRRLLCYETLSSTDAAAPAAYQPFLPNVFNDITLYMDQKLKIMALYQTEIQADPLPRGPAAIRALGRVRGATIGVTYAEAFMLIREVA